MIMIKKLTVAPMLLVLLVTTGILAILAYTMFTSKATNHGTETAAVSATEAQSSTPTPTTASQKQEGDEKQSLKSNTNPWDQDPRFLWSASIIAFVIVVWIWNRYNLSTSYWDKYWVNDSVIPALVCIGLVHLVIYKLAPQFWWNNIFNGWSFGLQLALLLVMSIKPENPKKPTKHKLSTVAAVLLGITFLLHITVGDVSVEEKFKHLSTAQATTRGSAPRLAPSISMGTPDCFKGQLGPDKDAAYAAFPGQMDVLAAFCRESNFDNRKIGQNENGSTDTGIAQINSAHDAELKRLGLDKNKLEDNLRYARIRYDKNGLLDWTPRTVNNRRLVFQVPVEPGNIGSNTFKLPYRDLKEFLWAPDRPALLIVKGADGTEHQVEFYPLSAQNKFVDLDPVVKPIQEYRFKSKDDKPVLVTVTYQY